MSLGMFAFEIGTLPFQELARTTDWRHGSSPRFGARPASQYLGPGEDRVNLVGALLPGLAGTYSSLRTLREMADQGDAWPLVEGGGRVLGNFRIDRIDERQNHFTVDGVPRRADFTVDLARVD
jgi:hypothetical protein